MNIVEGLKEKRETLQKELKTYYDKIEEIKHEIKKVENALLALNMPISKNTFGRGELRKLVLNHLGEFSLKMISDEIATIKNIEDKDKRYRLSRTLAVVLHKLSAEGLLIKKKERGLDTKYLNPKNS